MEVLSRSVCRSCRLRSIDLPLSRSFSTSSSRQAIPPESPHYVDVPSSLQDDLYRPRRRKGVLPVPRELFPAKRPDKPSAQYLANVTRDPLPKNVIAEDQLTENGKHRVRMAELRKTHLREGLSELYRRKQVTVAKGQRRSNTKRAERERLIAQAEREDSRLTSVSIPVGLRSGESNTPIADQLAVAKAIYETKKANYERVTTTKQEKRLDALHTLYMNARTFITTEAQLNDAIVEEFDKKTFKIDEGEGRSMWVMGPPDTIRAMVTKTQVTDKTMTSALSHLGFSDGTEERFLRDQERMKKIAEKLSGGKI